MFLSTVLLLSRSQKSFKGIRPCASRPKVQRWLQNTRIAGCEETPNEA